MQEEALQLEAHMISRARILARIAVVTLVLTAPVFAHHFLKHDIFIYDVTTAGHVYDATVTVNYSNGSQTAVTGRPHGNVLFRLPGELTSVQLVVVADGYCTFDESIDLGHRPHVGGRGIWIGLTPCAP